MCMYTVELMYISDLLLNHSLFLFPEIYVMVSGLDCIFQDPQWLRL